MGIDISRTFHLYISGDRMMITEDGWEGDAASKTGARGGVAG